MSVTQHHFATRGQASIALARAITRQLSRRLKVHQGATLVVSGGSSPLQVLGHLSATPLPWSRIHVLASDERMVDPSDPASNLGMIRRQLAIDRAAEVQLLDIARAGGEQLAQLPRPFTHVMLGMGGDGHTASLFPDAPELPKALASPPGHSALEDRSAGLMVMSPPSAQQQRITLTPSRLLDARRISLLAFGEDKLTVLQRALAPGPVAELPVRCVLHQDRVPVDVYWSL